MSRTHSGVNFSASGHCLYRIQQQVGEHLTQWASVDGNIALTRVARLNRNFRGIKSLFVEVQNFGKQLPYVSSTKAAALEQMALAAKLVFCLVRDRQQYWFKVMIMASTPSCGRKRPL